jgi:hypothetical protein
VPFDAQYGHAIVSRTGKRIAWRHGTRVLAWETASEKRLLEVVLADAVLGLGFASEERHLIAVCGRGTVYVFRLAPPAEAGGE